MTFRDPRADLVAEAYRRAKGHVAYLDESYQAPDAVAAHRQTFYIFTAVIVSPEARDELRSSLREIAGVQRWHTTEALLTGPGRETTRKMLEFLAEGDEVCVIAHQVPVGAGDHDAEDARRACYRGLAASLAAGRAGHWGPIELLVLEERNQRNFRNKDHKNHAELIAEKRIPRSTRLLQVSPAHERLLWLPDLVSSAYRRTLTHHDATRELFGVVESHVHFVEPSAE